MSGFVWSDRHVRRALGLRAELAAEDVTYTGVSTDSRTIRAGDLYVALVGERFDGHDFVADALARGGGGAVVSRPVPGEPAGRLYPVGDTLEALGALAAYRRRALAAPVVAITGSAGKTGTKEFTRAALAAAYRVHATEGNLNNRIGVPLTLLGVPSDVEVVVLELGTNEPGEIAALAAMVRPDVAVITNVGESHLEGLGSIEGVLDEKLELLRGMVQGGTCVVGDKPSVLAERAAAFCPRLRVAGWSDAADPDLRPEGVEQDVFGGYRFRWHDHAVALQVPGRHAVSNALLALAVADVMGVGAAAAARAVSAVTAGAMRGEVRRLNDLTLIVDCYNANPQSVHAALDLLESLGAHARTVAVLGSMLELGTQSARLHREALLDALARPIDLVVATGAFAAAAHVLEGPAEASAGEGSAARGAGSDEAVEEEEGRHPGGPEILVRSEWADAYPELRARLAGGEVVLLKASRGVALEGMLPLLERDFGSAAAPVGGVC